MTTHLPQPGEFYCDGSGKVAQVASVDAKGVMLRVVADDDEVMIYHETTIALQQFYTLVFPLGVTVYRAGR